MFVEDANAGAAQHDDVAFGAEGVGEIAGHGADVETLAGADAEGGGIFRDDFDQSGVVDGDRPALKLEVFAIAGEIIGAFAIDFDGGELWRDLFDLADESGQRGKDCVFCRADIGAGDLDAFGIIAGGGDAPLDGEDIVFVGIHGPGDGFGGVAEGDGQDASGERVERAAMADFGRVEQAFERADGLS